MKSFLSLSEAMPRMMDNPFVDPANWQMQEGEVWALTGGNGSGKSLLAGMIAGKCALQHGEITYSFAEAVHLQFPDKPFHPWEHVRLVGFHAAYSLADYRTLYYQQRYHQTETDDSPLVRDILAEEERESMVAEALQIEHLLDKRLIQLSSGELRKLLIAKVMTGNPRLVIFDNPFIGLDATSRALLDDLFTGLHRHGMPLIFLCASQREMPSCVTHVLQMSHCAIVNQMPVGQFCELHTDVPAYLFDTSVDGSLFGHSVVSTEDYAIAVKMEHVNIEYGTKVIRKDVNWTILKGEKWALAGPNGAGKSTLLSYIFADNPQAYSKQLTLFDRLRGTGESIWEIKARIGFTSSEMHLYYRENVSCLAVVASGFFDSIGLYRKCSEQQMQQAEQWLKLLESEHLKDRMFLKISSGEQRLVLFARALVKNPALLILDEPFHGLDDRKKALCRHIVETYASQPDKTLIYVTHHREEIPDCVGRYMELGF
ncbi:ATP-binding cassette domain-containing protein [Microbacter margulisiae]|uniref:Molybdate transport system ATP-binding protein n=1 Tax=Microbacter margulisiae TaxID=1350067 RepID=A0A7W5H3A8_9PORP|nr:ATP-binding cassette domain-containing protein [Microbacter margulisiae]MBB3188419.1 molybdate transport system ATP-binding protein [Microbacter margulisiae]